VIRLTRWLCSAGAWAVSAQALLAQPPRPVLDGEFVVRHVDSLWAEAVTRGTRRADGTPGPKHWVQSARYELAASVDPVTATIRGSGLLRYRNRSPDTLRTISLALAQNLFRAGAPHDEVVPRTDGIVLDSLCIAHLSAAPASRRCGADGAPAVSRDLRVDFTVAWLTLPVPLAPGDSLDLRARWRFTLPSDDAPRIGTDGAVSMIGYWYPQFAVYDDVVGWQADPYLATGEFYMDPADYDVRITLPGGYLVAATGVLQNPADVLPAGVRERLARARRSFAAVPVVSDSVRRAGGATLASPQLTWRFSATGVRDFAFYTSRKVVWDAMAALVPRAGTAHTDTVLIHAFYRPSETGWRRAADYGRQSIEHFSKRLWPYPWPQMTLVEGIVDGGMEYPMLTIVSAGNDPRALLTTVGHEVGHMWTPMQVGSDERRFAWMDEGIASWLERSLLRASTGRDDDDEGIPDLYRMTARIRAEQSMLTHADHYSGTLTYTAASYDKLVVVLRAFAAEYGDSAVVHGLRAYGAAWTGRHPYPPDFTRLVFAAAGAERDAFVREWVAGTGSFDARIDSVRRQGRDSLAVHLHVHGGAYLSVPVVVRRDDGRSERIVVPAAAFRAERAPVLVIGRARAVTSIVLDPERTRPDLDTGNQRWAPR